MRNTRGPIWQEQREDVGVLRQGMQLVQRAVEWLPSVYSYQLGDSRDHEGTEAPAPRTRLKHA